MKRVAGRWSESAYRHASREHLATSDSEATLEFDFTGTGLAVVLEAHGLPFSRLGQVNLGSIAIKIDGRLVNTIDPQREDRDVVVARGLNAGPHRVRLETRTDSAGGGVKLAGFRALQGGEGDLSFLVHGEANRFLTDLRAIVRNEGKIVRDELIRNWLTGQCRIVGLPIGTGYVVELIASGWQPERLRDVEVTAGRETVLRSVFLRRIHASSRSGVEYPYAGSPAIVKGGGSFDTRFTLGISSPPVTIHLERRVGPALISRRASWLEDKERFYDGRAEGTVTTPADTPPGLYDLVFRISQGGRTREQIAARSVHVVDAYPTNPVFFTFGHMDTWGQEQAEYLEHLVEVANLIAPDMVLVSNEVNAAYASGAFSGLQMPYVITFGNHSVSGHEEWYGRAAGMVDFGPDLSILNISYPWHGDLTPAVALLESRAGSSCRIINAFESDAPVDLLDRFRIPYLHDAHGEGPRVMQMGSTPTQRAGKQNSESFRVVRFEGCTAVSFTYAGDPVAPIPMPRGQPAPLRASFLPANDGSHRTVKARVQNDWAQSFPDGRITLVMPAAEYAVDRGRIESAVESDDGRFVVLSIRLDLPAGSTAEVTVAPRALQPGEHP